MATCRYLYTDEVSLFADPFAAQREESEPHAPSRCSCPHCASPTPTSSGAGAEGASTCNSSFSESAAIDAHVRRMRRLVDVLYAAHKYLVHPLVDAAIGELAQMLCAHTAAPILALSFLFEVPSRLCPHILLLFETLWRYFVFMYSYIVQYTIFSKYMNEIGAIGYVN